MDKRWNKSGPPLATVARGMLMRHQGNLAMPAFEGAHLSSTDLATVVISTFCLWNLREEKMAGKETEWPQKWTSLVIVHCSHWMTDGWQPLNSSNLPISRLTIKLDIQRKPF